jgi:hypothetical protein
MAEPSSGAVIQKMLGFRELFCRRVRHVASLGEELSHQAVGIFIRAALPCTIGLCEAHSQRGRRRLPVLDLAQQQVARFPVHQRNGAGAMSPGDQRCRNRSRA